MKGIIIQGSARANGNTARIAQRLVEKTGWDICHLSEYNINHYDYEHGHEKDDFLPLITKLIREYDVLIFATPVYWYSMSGRMKVFFDRMTDLLKVEKELGRGLRGHKMAVFCSSNSESAPAEFWMPFNRTAEYLGMDYLGGMHFYNDQSSDTRLDEFIKLVAAPQPKTKPHPFKTAFLDHVAIRVRNIDTSVLWYEEVLGLKTYRIPEWGAFPVFMMAGTSGVALFPEKAVSDPSVAPEKQCVDHFAFHVTMDDLDQAKAHYEKLGIAYDEQDHHYFISVYTKDPDGHTVELTALKSGKEYFYNQN